MTSLSKLEARPPREATRRNGESRAIDRPSQDIIEGAYRDILAFVGEDPDREGLLRTPHRVAEVAQIPDTRL